MSALNRQAVKVIIHTTILLQEVETLKEMGGDQMWMQKLKFNGNNFIKAMEEYTNKNKNFYEEGISKSFYEALDVMEEFTQHLTIEKIDEINNYLKTVTDEQ